MKKILFIGLSFLLSSIAIAQSALERSEIGISAGGMNYIGDLNKQSMFGKPHMGYGVFYRFNIDNRWAVMVGGSYGHIEGGNPDKIQLRNLDFYSHIYEGYARAEFNFRPFGAIGKSFRCSTFLFIGLGMFGFNPQTEYFNSATGETEWIDLCPLGTEGQGTEAYPDRIPYSLTQFMMPFGFGAKFHLGKALYISAEYGFRKTWTDYLDDVSTTYVDPSILSPLAAELADKSSEIKEGYKNIPGVKRGDSTLDDWYAYFNISISFSMEFLFGWMKSKNCEL